MEKIIAHKQKLVFLDYDNENIETNTSCEVFIALVEALDNITVKTNTEIKNPFEIKLGEFIVKSVYFGRLTTTDSPDSQFNPIINEKNSNKIDKAIQAISISVNPKLFTFQDIPKLIKCISETHNKWIEDLNRDDKLSYSNASLLSRSKDRKNNESELWQINPGVAIAKRYLTLAKIFNRVLDGAPENSISSIFRSVIADINFFLEETAREYGVNSVNFVEQINHINEDKIVKFLNRDRNPNSLLRRLPSIIKIITNNLKEAGKQDLRSLIFELSQAEVMRLTGMDDLIKDFEESSDLKILELKNRFENENDINKKADIQILIAQQVNNFLFNSNYFPYKKDFHKPNQIAEQRYVNCVARGFLQYTIWLKYFGIELNGASTKSHFFTILPLANGNYLHLDGKVEVLKDGDGNPIKKLQHRNSKTNHYASWFNAGNFEVMMTSEIYSCIGNDENLDPLQREMYNFESLKLYPYNVGSLRNFAYLYMKHSEKFENKFGSKEKVLFEAQRLYLKVIELDPPLQCIFNLRDLYEENLDIFEKYFNSKELVFQEIVKLYSQSILLDPDNPITFLNFGVLYQKNCDSLGGKIVALAQAKSLYLKAVELAEKTRNPYLNWIRLVLAMLYRDDIYKHQDALNLYTEVLGELEKNLNIPLFFDKETIEAKIAELQSVM